TLGLACVLAGQWIRSLSIEDQIYFSIGKTTPVLLFSTQGYIVWGMFLNLDRKDLDGQPPHWRSLPLDPELGSREPLFFQNPEFTWRWWICAVVEDVAAIRRFRFLIISYLSLIIPLTLLSAFLILWTPRQRVTKLD
ncbi:MAG TPA: hypothetical protein VGM98_00130, partial [Schlesneria sp.]